MSMRGPHRPGLRVQYNGRLATGFLGGGGLYGDEEVAGEKIVEQVAERRGVTQLGGGNHSICLTPFPAGSRRNTLQSFPQIRGGHRIRVDAHVLREQTSKRFQRSAFEIAVNVVERSNDQGETCDEAHRRLRITVYESLHLVELALAKQHNVAAGGEKSVDSAKQIGNLRHRLVRSERSGRQTKKANRRRGFFAHLLLKLLNSRSQQSHVNLGVSSVTVAKISRRKHHGFLVERFGRRDYETVGVERSGLGESCTH